MNIGEGRDGISRDDARIKFKREANEARRLRILDAKKRVIGLDVDALNEQVADKERMKSNQKEQEAIERLRFMEIEKIMEQASSEEKMMQNFEKQRIKQSWEDAISYKNSRPADPDFDPDRTGVSAAQVFSGEDRNRTHRLADQKQQMSKWIQEQVADKSYHGMMNREDDAKYAQLMRAVDSIREAAEQEELDMQRYLKKTVKDDNDILTITQRENKQCLSPKYAFKGLTAQEQLAATSLNAFSEDASIAMDENGRIIRKDMFRGYTEAQKRRILQENEEVARQTRERKQAGNYAEADYAMHLTLMGRAMEYASWEEDQMKKEMQAKHNDTLAHQAAEQRFRRETSNKERYGSIDSDFFNNFGKSHR